MPRAAYFRAMTSLLPGMRGSLSSGGRAGGTDPVTGASNDQTLEPYWQPTQAQMPLYLDAQGASFYRQRHASKLFSSTPVDLTYDLFAIPGGAVTLFEVTLEIWYGFSDGGGNVSDTVLADFANEKSGYSIICPSVELEILTPVGAAGNLVK